LLNPGQNRWIQAKERDRGGRLLVIENLDVGQAGAVYLFSAAELLEDDAPHRWLRFTPRDAGVELVQPRHDRNCNECGNGPRGRLAKGSSKALPTRLR
jgi:hypothetical protein